MNYLKKAAIILLLIFLQTAFAQSNSATNLHSADPAISETPSCTAPTATLVLFCDGSTTTSTSYDFNNAGQTVFQYSYTIDGGAPITGSFSAPSHYTVTGLSPGQSVAFTLTWAGLCGINSKTITCTSSCLTTAAPNFGPIAPICAGTTAPVLPSVSPNGISGSWSPGAISNATSGTYVFTPTSPCSSPQTVNVTVTPKVTPTFNPIPAVCQNSPAPVLPSMSTNATPISGSWSPAVSTATIGTRTYTFTPNPGQCTTSSPVTLALTVTSNTVPQFAPVQPFCSGTNPPVLPTTSLNGITGSWSPALVSNTASGNYTFTPAPGQCAASKVITTTVTPSPVPLFAQIAPFCSGTIAPLLPQTSNNGITGTWNPPLVSNTGSGNYTFTPTPGQCGAATTMQILVNSPTAPDFANISFCSGSSVPSLPGTSPNGIHGTWSPPIIDPTTPSQYVFTPNEGECATPQTINVGISVPTLTAASYSVTNAFNENQIVTVLTSSPGSYLYQLDFGPLYETNVFEHVAPGTHTITVYDANGCSAPITFGDVLVVNYPHYFTPNSDGINDFWRIGGLSPDATVAIFDRYGKLLQNIAASGPGWDGTYNGKLLPSSDYWFVVRYLEQNRQHEFSAHFTLKR